MKAESLADLIRMTLPSSASDDEGTIKRTTGKTTLPRAWRPKAERELKLDSGESHENLHSPRRQGSNRLARGLRVWKNSPRLEVIGTLDELNSMLGLIRIEPLPEEIERILGPLAERIVRRGKRIGLGRCGRIVPPGDRQRAHPGLGSNHRSVPGQVAAHQGVYSARRGPIGGHVSYCQDDLPEGRAASGCPCPERPKRRASRNVGVHKSFERSDVCACTLSQCRGRYRRCTVEKSVN